VVEKLKISQDDESATRKNERFEFLRIGADAFSKHAGTDTGRRAGGQIP
jgi:hypothetical protein